MKILEEALKESEMDLNVILENGSSFVLLIKQFLKINFYFQYSNCFFLFLFFN